LSVADLKDRLADVPGIENLTMRPLLGRHVYGFDGLIAAVDPMATDQDIETSIRNAVAARFTPLPVVTLTETKPMSAATTGYQRGSITSALQALKDRGAAITANARASAAKLTAAYDAAEKLNQSMSDDADNLMAELGQFTNFPPA